MFNIFRKKRVKIEFNSNEFYKEVRLCKSMNDLHKLAEKAHECYIQSVINYKYLQFLQGFIYYKELSLMKKKL